MGLWCETQCKNYWSTRSENNQGCQLQHSPLCYFSWKNEPPGWQNSYHGNGSEPKVTSLDRSPTSSIYLVRDLGRAGSLPWTSTTTWAGHTPRTANSQASRGRALTSVIEAELMETMVTQALCKTGSLHFDLTDKDVWPYCLSDFNYFSKDRNQKLWHTRMWGVWGVVGRQIFSQPLIKKFQHTEK